MSEFSSFTEIEKLRQAIAEKLLNVEGVLFDFALKGYTVSAICRKPDEPESFVVVSNDTPPFLDALEKAHRETIHPDWDRSGALGVIAPEVIEEWAKKERDMKDGGALETAYSQGFEAGKKANSDQPEPYPPYSIGTDMANDWLRGYRSAIDASALDATPPPD